MTVGIPYMGNKTKLAKKIVDKILYDNPGCKYFYDLFGGGGSVSFEALTRPIIESVHYNELDTGVVSLLEDVLANGVCDRHYQWICREDFHKLKHQVDWLGGLVKTCWSFGNNASKGYLYSPKNEEMKICLHELIVNPSEKQAGRVSAMFGLDIPSSVCGM
jgi:hypothetical protein